MWTDWRTTSYGGGGKEESLELSAKEEIVAISGYSWDGEGHTGSLQAKSSAGRSWGPHGEHTPSDGWSLRSSPNAPTNGLRLNHLSGDQTETQTGDKRILNYILRWLHQYNQIKT